ncbi:MAG TPA: anaerobic ribonucleoside triphosphate reductase [Candidatus Avidesulfovibrio excrementigallinarum]|nr:anaerobic ribonucleoside triphosphate reductase [Candidatus Avidesulfovibrio excrementigallinarum]
MMTSIRKRDSRIVPFNVSKIADAIFKAAKTQGGTDPELAMQLAKQVEEQLVARYGDGVPDVEEVQDLVEKTLIETGHARTAKAYILYRNERTRIRVMKTRLMSILKDLSFKEARDNDLKRENANIDGDTAMGTMLKFGSEAAKQFYECFLLKPEHSQAHIDGDIHIHDLDFLSLTTTCCQIDIKKLFKGGFNTGHGFLREPNSIQSTSALACIAIQSNQNDQHGGQSIPNFEYGMAPGVAKSYIKNLDLALDMRDADPEFRARVSQTLRSYLTRQEQADSTSLLLDETGQAVVLNVLCTGMSEGEARHLMDKALARTDKDTYQAMEGLVHNLNTMHSRAGAQIPFSSINYGTDTSPEGRMAIRNILLATEAGLGNGETPIFPIHIFKVKEGVNFNPGDPNYDLFKLACRVSAKRLFPNFSFLDAPFNKVYYREGRPETEIAYMGCRTRVIGNIHDPSREIVNGRGNLSFTSLNLPRLGLKHRGDVDGFFKDLDALENLVFDQLLERLEIQSAKKVKNYPFLMGQGIWIDSDKLGPEDEVREVLKHGTLTIGFIGLAECLTALIGVHHGQSEQAQQLGLRIVGRIRELADAKSRETGLNFSVIATPAEGLAGRFVRLDRALFGSIPNITDRDYYTNSFHIPVHFQISAYEKIRLEAPYHAMTNGGHITYVEVDGDPSKNLEAFEDIVRAMERMGIGYGSINHPVDRDPVCGYTGIIGDVCPRCGRHDGEGIPLETLRKIKGYIKDPRTPDEVRESGHKIPNCTL